MKPLTIISGIPSSLTVGAGRLIQHLVTDALTWGPAVKFVFTGNKGEVAAAYRKRKVLKFAMQATLHYLRRVYATLTLSILIKRPHVVLIHFQEIGVHWCKRFLVARKLPTWIYVLDASYFCLRSYNYLPGESDACLRCLGGDYTHAEANGCKPFPIANTETLDFIRFLGPLVASGKVCLLAQNKRNAELMQRHYGPGAIVEVIGLWTVDMNDFPESTSPAPTAKSAFDVVYHGDAKEVKGLHWALLLARHCPELSFLFPCHAAPDQPIPDNCTFAPMRWETGLREAVQTSKLTLAPSLWSAPIEGALVKSILHAQRVAVIEVASAYSSELPPELVCHLPQDIGKAAEALTKRLAAPATSRALIRSWFLESRKMARLIHRISLATLSTSEMDAAVKASHAT